MHLHTLFCDLGRDCINGTLMEKNKMPRKVNFTRLLQIFGSGKTKKYTLLIYLYLTPTNSIEDVKSWNPFWSLSSAEGYNNRLDKSVGKDSEMRNIPFDVDITIYKETRLKMNHEGCSNSLSEECTAFHRDFGRVRWFVNLLMGPIWWRFCL